MKKNKIVIISLVLSIIFSCGKPTIETKPIRKDITETVFATGVLEAENTYHLTAQADGYIAQINFEEGNLINKNDVFALISNQEHEINLQSANALYLIAANNTKSNSPLLLQAKNNIANAQKKYQLDSIQLFRYKKLFEVNSVSKLEYENMEVQFISAKNNLANAYQNYQNQLQINNEALINNDAKLKINNVAFGNNALKALTNGKVYKKYKQVGDFVRKGDVLALIGNAQSLYAKVSIDEGNINKIKVGQQVLVTLNTNTNKVYEGILVEILPQFDEATQSFVCKIKFNAEIDFKIINTQLQCNIIVGVQKNALLIPRSFIDYGGNVMVKGNKAPHKVKTNFISNEWVHVLEGIDENTILVSDKTNATKTELNPVQSNQN
jgi:HlyD family secretion protein